MTAYLVTIDGKRHYIKENYPPIECFRCGNCCTSYQPQLSPDEIQRMAEKLSRSAKAFISSYTQATYTGYLLRRSNKGCIFLSRRKNGFSTCRIYPFRPEVCRNWAPSLTRRECIEGLKRFKTKGSMLLPHELYPGIEALERFVQQLTDGL